MAKFGGVSSSSSVLMVFWLVVITAVGGSEDSDGPQYFTPAPSSEATLKASNGVGYIFDTVLTTSIRNNLDAELTDLNTFLYYGRCISIIPSVIKPEEEAILVGHKTNFFSFHGVGGLFTVRIDPDGADLMLGIIFSSPHPLGRRASETWLGLSFIRNRSSSLEEMYDYLYYSQGWKSASKDKVFGYAKEHRTLVLKNETIIVTASMQDVRWPILQVDVVRVEY